MKKKYRKVTINNVVWKYKVGSSFVEMRTDNKKIIAKKEDVGRMVNATCDCSSCCDMIVDDKFVLQICPSDIVNYINKNN